MEIVRSAMTVLVLILSSSCAAPQRDLLKAGSIKLDLQGSNTLLAPSVYEEDGSLIVDGRLPSPSVDPEGHIDISLVTSDGSVVSDAQVNFRPHAFSFPGGGQLTRIKPRRARAHLHYSIRFPALPPAGSTVRVRFDGKAHDQPRL